MRGTVSRASTGVTISRLGGPRLTSENGAPGALRRREAAMTRWPRRMDVPAGLPKGIWGSRESVRVSTDRRILAVSRGYDSVVCRTDARRCAAGLPWPPTSMSASPVVVVAHRHRDTVVRRIIGSISFRRGCRMTLRRRVSVVDRRARVARFEDARSGRCGYQRFARQSWRTWLSATRRLRSHRSINSAHRSSSRRPRRALRARRWTPLGRVDLHADGDRRRTDADIRHQPAAAGCAAPEAHRSSERAHSVGRHHVGGAHLGHGGPPDASRSQRDVHPRVVPHRPDAARTRRRDSIG